MIYDCVKIGANMNRQVLLYSLILLFAVCASAISQVILKKAAIKEYDSPIREYLNLYVITAYAIFFGTTFLGIIAYRYVPLSMGPILEATSYIYVTVFGVKIFGEKIDRRRIMALCVIIAGIAVFTLCG